MKEYLKDSEQFIEVDGVRSEYRGMTCGVPQGLVQGPIIFLIIINDLPNAMGIKKALFTNNMALNIGRGSQGERTGDGGRLDHLNKMSLNWKKIKLISYNNNAERSRRKGKN